MPIIDDVWTDLRTLATAGWAQTFTTLGLDLGAADPTTALGTWVDVDRTRVGFEDFAANRARFIEPGDPARSLLLHTLASPRVAPAGVTAWPTVAQLDRVENLVFAAASRSLAGVRNAAADKLGLPEAAADDLELAVVTFASEYRSAGQTPHGRAADLCLARTGVARVGTHDPDWDGEMRAYRPHGGKDGADVIRAVPARYGAWLAVRATGDARRFGPLAPANLVEQPERPDSDYRFWVPIHKLFDGTECLTGLDLAVAFEARHVNEKLTRLFAQLALVDGRLPPEGIGAPPYTVVDGLATTGRSGATLEVRPTPGPMVKAAESNGAPLTFKAPAMGGTFSSAFRPSLTLGGGDGYRSFPEYAHVRTTVENGELVDLESKPALKNDLETFLDNTSRGDYPAVAYHDPSGDGWVRATVQQGGTALSDDGGELPRVAAFSILAAPDFYPGVNQRSLVAWWRRTVQADPATLPAWQAGLFASPGWQRLWRAPPDDLSGLRIAGNTSLGDTPFSRDDQTVTAIVSVPRDVAKLPRPAPTREPNRQSTLPDAAAGFFAPGWDVSRDRDLPASGTPSYFLAGHGLGTPFPEDAKLCAALSTFWPAAAPDTTRTFVDVDRMGPAGPHVVPSLVGAESLEVEFSRGTVCPMTDDELGVGDGAAAWDGVVGPHVAAGNAHELQLSYPVFSRADYTVAAREGRMSIATTAKVGLEEYQRRMLAMGRCYRALEQRHPQRERATVHIFSFREQATDDPELASVISQMGWPPGPVYRFDTAYQADLTHAQMTDGGKRVLLGVANTSTVLVGPGRGVAVVDRIGTQVADWRAETDV